MLILIFISSLLAQDLKTDAPQLAKAMKEEMLSNLQREIAKGSGEAIDFCAIHATEMKDNTLKKKANLYEMGRTSHKLRNANNEPADWMNEYLEKFKGTNTTNPPMKMPLIHKLKDNTQVWIAPIYTEALCLQCHGDKVSTHVETQLKKNYPMDQARGFGLGEFRGFVWVKEKAKK